MVLKAFSIHNKILTGPISNKGKSMCYKQGDGITLGSIDYPGLIYNIRIKDIFGGRIRLFEKLLPSFQHPDFSAAGRSRDPRLCGPIYQSFLKMVHGGSEQTLRVLVAYYQQKTESIAYTASVIESNIVPPTNKSDYSVVQDSIMNELSKNKLMNLLRDNIKCILSCLIRSPLPRLSQPIN